MSMGCGDLHFVTYLMTVLDHMVRLGGVGIVLGISISSIGAMRHDSGDIAVYKMLLVMTPSPKFHSL